MKYVSNPRVRDRIFFCPKCRHNLVRQEATYTYVCWKCNSDYTFEYMFKNQGMFDNNPREPLP